MKFRVKCSCGESMAVSENLGGKTVKCSSCGELLQVPVTVRCQCGHVGAIPKSSTAKVFKCPKCGGQLQARQSADAQPSAISDMLDEIEEQEKMPAAQDEPSSTNDKRRVSADTKRLASLARSGQGRAKGPSRGMPRSVLYYGMMGLGLFLLLPFLTGQIFITHPFVFIGFVFVVVGLVGAMFWS